MNLKQWRKEKGYSLRQVAAMLDKNTHQAVHNIETRGARTDKTRMDLKRLSLGKITDFTAYEELKG